jgi:hypothetical protein
LRRISRRVPSPAPAIAGFLRRRKRLGRPSICCLPGPSTLGASSTMSPPAGPRTCSSSSTVGPMATVSARATALRASSLCVHGGLGRPRGRQQKLSDAGLGRRAGDAGRAASRRCGPLLRIGLLFIFIFRVLYVNFICNVILTAL